jgi:hypothetical protein
MLDFDTAWRIHKQTGMSAVDIVAEYRAQQPGYKQRPRRQRLPRISPTLHSNSQLLVALHDDIWFLFTFYHTVTLRNG